MSFLQAEKNKNELMDNLGKAALQVGSDFFVALRWGAANALTAALPEEQRKVLLDRMDPEPPKYLMNPSPKGGDLAKAASDHDEEEVLIKNSVNEAVATAVAVQSQREKKWEQEKEQILAMAEEAATKRVETDFAIQKQRLEQEQRALQESTQIAKLELEVEKKTLAIQAARELKAKEDAFKKELEEREAELREEIEKEMAVAAIANGTAALDTSGFHKLPEHPVLGKAIQDLGYKRMHLVSAEKLATIPVWKKQRIYRHERAKAMAADKLKTLHLGLPGVICLHEEENGKLSILDGQHRVGMMKIIQEKQDQEKKGNAGKPKSSDYVDLDNVLVEVYPQNSKIRPADHAQDIFMEINKAEPIKLVDMPGMATAKDRNMISQAVYKLEDQYPTMFSPSQRCRAPNVNVDNLRDNVFAANVIKRHNIKSASQLLDWMLQENDRLEKKFANDLNAQADVSATAWKKAFTNKFYLGLESNWLYN
jgi:hypothetical protein